MHNNERINRDRMALLQHLQPKIDELAESNSVLSALLNLKIDRLVKDINALAGGRYNTEDKNEVVLLFEELYGHRDLVEVKTAIWAGHNSCSIWSPQLIGQQYVDSVCKAAVRAVKTEHIFFVEECLQFAGNPEWFDMATELVKSNIKVVLVELSHDELEQSVDFSLFELRDGQRIALSSVVRKGPVAHLSLDLVVGESDVQELFTRWRTQNVEDSEVQLMRV